MAYAESSESRNWNTAKNYSERKIMKHLANIDKYIEICNFGTEIMEDELSTDPKLKAQAKITALKRLSKTLEMLCRNCYFAVKKPDKKKLKKIKTSILNISKFIDSSYHVAKDERTGGTKLIIYELIYQHILSMYVQLAEDLMSPLNNADLIFSSVEEWDAEKLIAEHQQRFVHGG